MFYIVVLVGYFLYSVKLLGMIVFLFSIVFWMIIENFFVLMWFLVFFFIVWIKMDLRVYYVIVWIYDCGVFVGLMGIVIVFLVVVFGLKIVVKN